MKKIPKEGDIAFMEEYGPGMFIEVVKVRTKAVRKKRKIGGTFWKPVYEYYTEDVLDGVDWKYVGDESGITYTSLSTMTMDWVKMIGRAWVLIAQADKVLKELRKV